MKVTTGAAPLKFEKPNFWNPQDSIHVAEHYRSFKRHKERDFAVVENGNFILSPFIAGGNQGCSSHALKAIISIPD